ncbi:MAG: response regulator [Chromatiales bacterium]|nr:response regulator [Chromatiales bacterium]
MDTGTGERMSNSHIVSVLVVDDDLIHCRFMESSLKEHYHVHCIHSVSEAIDSLSEGELQPEIILLDFNMPGADGRELIYALKDNPKIRHIPFIFVTSESDPSLQEQTLGLGAVDYLIKPIQAGILKRKVDNHIRNHQKNSALYKRNKLLNNQLTDTIQELQVVQDVTIMALATLTEVRNAETGDHIWRTQEYVKVLAQLLRQSERYCETLTERDIYLMYKSAPLHDIGKVGIPDEILSKPAALTADEIEVIKTHPLIGFNALSHAESLYPDTQSSFLKYAREICCSHHERWDGNGYPHGLVGDEIPLSARIMAIADVYDALVSERAYKDAMPHEEAVSYICGQSGASFDPYIIGLFEKNHLEFKAIAAVSEEFASNYSPMSIA